MTAQRGFSLVELLFSSAITLALAGSVFSMLAPMHGAFAMEPERADMRQRLRAAADALARDLLAAAPLQSALPAWRTPPARPPVAPYRYGVPAADPPGSYRADIVTVTVPDPAGGPGDIRAFLLTDDPVSGMWRLRRDRVGGASVPVADHIVALRFEYFGGPSGALTPMDAARLTDGPWHPDSSSPDRYDVDLLAIRTVRVMLRVEAASNHLRGPAGPLFVRPGTASGTHVVPDMEARFDVALRTPPVLRP